MASTRRVSPSRRHFNAPAHAPAVPWDAPIPPADQGPHHESSESHSFQHRMDMVSHHEAHGTYRRRSMDSGGRGGASGLRRQSLDEPAAATTGHLPSAVRHGWQQEAHHHGHHMTTKPREHHHHHLREAPAGNVRARGTSAVHSNVARVRLSLDEARSSTSAFDHHRRSTTERSADNNHRRMSLDECRGRPSSKHSATGKALRPSTALYSEGRAVPLARSGRGISETLIASDHHPYGSGGGSAPTSRRGSRTDPGQAPRGSKHASCMKVSGNIDSFIREKGGAASHHKSFLHLSDRASSVQSLRTMDASELEESLCVLPRHESCPSPQLLMAITRNPSVASDQGYVSHGNSEGDEGGSSRGVELPHEESFEEAAVPHDEGDDDDGTGQAQPPWKRTVVQSAVGRAAIRKEAKAQMNISGSRPLKGKAAVRKEIDDFLIRMTGGNKNSEDDEGGASGGFSRRPVSSLARKNLFSRGTEDGQSTPNQTSSSGSGSSRKLQTSGAFKNMLKPNPHIKISDGRKVPLKELQGMLEEFSKHDTAGDGDVSLQHLGPAKHVNAGATQNGERMSMFNANRVSRKSLEQAGMYRKSKSFQKRIRNGKISFKDMIHIQYPTANEEELDIMVNETSRFQEMKLSDFSPTKVKKSQSLYKKIDAKGRADGVTIDVLEDFFLEHAPTSTDIYHVLQTIQPDAKERMYNKEGVLSEQEFVMWALTFEMKTGHQFPLAM